MAPAESESESENEMRFGFGSGEWREMCLRAWFFEIRFVFPPGLWTARIGDPWEGGSLISLATLLCYASESTSSLAPAIELAVSRYLANPSHQGPVQCIH